MCGEMASLILVWRSLADTAPVSIIPPATFLPHLHLLTYCISFVTPSLLSPSLLFYVQCFVAGQFVRVSIFVAR